MRRSDRFRRPAFLLSLVLAAAFAQQPVQAPKTGVTFKAGANLVIVDVTVKDRDGKAIDSLTSKDFTVLEDGKPQKIDIFETQKLETEPEPPDEAPTLGSQNDLPEQPKTTITTESPGKIQYHDKRLLVLFFDFSNMGIPEELRAQEAALDFIDKQMTKSDLMAILLNTAAVKVQTDFTGDRDQLKDIINNLPIGELSDLADVADDGSDDNEDTGAAFVADETEFNIYNTDRKLQAIEDAVRMLSALPEKKVLIYVTAGLSKTGIENQAQLEASVNAAVKANVAIYPLDARGLMADPPGGGASKGASRGNGIYTGSVYNSQRSAINNSQETLVTLAADTGGKAFLDSNDLKAGLVQAQQEFRSYYILGYYTTNTAEDGKYRKITVKLNRNTTAKLEFRQGYFANKVWTKFSGAEKEQHLMEALAAGDPMTDLPIVLAYDYFRISPTAYFVPVSVKVPGSALELAQKHGLAETEFDFLGSIIDERKQSAGMVRDFIKVKLDAANAERMLKRNFTYDAGFTLAPGKYQIKFLVRENHSGKMGTFQTKFVIPDLTADSTLLKTSSIIWSSQRQPIKEAVGAAEHTNRKMAAANPLIVGDEKIVPNIAKLFRRSQNMYVSFDVYDAAPDPANPQGRKIAVTMSLFNQKGLKAFESAPVYATQLTPLRPNTVPVQLQVPLKGLAPGQYVCQLNVVDEVGRRFAFPRAALVVQ